MSREILEITPSGGIYCLIPPRNFKMREAIDCARVPSYSLNEILDQIRLDDYRAETNFRTDGDILRWAIARICETPVARNLAHDARFENWGIGIDGDAVHPKIDTKNKCLILPRHADSAVHLARGTDTQMEFLFDLVKGLRLIWQDGQIDFDMQDLAVEDHLKAARVAEADTDLIAILTAYQMRANGQHDMWRNVLSADLHGMAVTLSECLDYDSSEDGVLEALGFVFQDWFLDDARLAQIDHETLARIDALEDGMDGHDTLGFDDILKLSMLPQGFSYLEYVASDILSDAFYARMTNDVNAAHLKQILQETNIALIEEIGFRDMDLARKFFPQTSFETVV